MKLTIGVFWVLLGLRGAHELVLENIDAVEDDATGSEEWPHRPQDGRRVSMTYIFFVSRIVSS